MNELLALVKTNLKVRRNLTFGTKDEKSGKKSSDIGLFLSLFLVSMEFSVINGFDMLKNSHNQQLVFKGIIGLELVSVVFYSFFNIIDTYYLASDWREMTIYPVKPRILLMSKCTLTSIQNFVIAGIFVPPLFTYGALAKKNILYYIYVIGGSALIAIITVVYITSILSGIFWIIALIRKSKRGNRKDKLIIVIDIIVIGLNFGTLNSSAWIKTAAFIGAAILSSLGLYFIGGNVYSTIMKSEIFSKSDSKVIETDISKYKFSEKNIILSNVIRDLRTIIRVPVLRFNCFTCYAVISLICMAIILFARGEIGELRGGVSGTMLIPIIMFLTTINFTPITSFSREGKSIIQFKAFPINNNKLLVAKVYVGLISNINTFIVSNVFIFLVCTNWVDFVLLELIAISYIFMMTISHIKMDSSNIYSGWVNIKELFQFEHMVKIFIPITIITILDYVYLFGTLAIRHQSQVVLEGITFIYLMIISVVWSIIDIKKLKQNMLK